MPVTIFENQHQQAITCYCDRTFGGSMVVTRGRLIDASTLPGFVWEEEGSVLGAILYELRGNDCEIVLLYSESEGRGIAGKLIEAVREVAKRNCCGRVWLITTNDNTHAIRYYQKRGFSLKAAHIGAIEESRKLKPGIPLTGNDGIPIQHEMEFEIRLFEREGI